MRNARGKPATVKYTLSGRLAEEKRVYIGAKSRSLKSGTRSCKNLFNVRPVWKTYKEHCGVVLRRVCDTTIVGSEVRRGGVRRWGDCMAWMKMWRCY